jgi:hypothetical protein
VGHILWNFSGKNELGRLKYINPTWGRHYGGGGGIAHLNGKEGKEINQRAITNEKGTNKIRAKLVYTGYPFISSEIITNEVEINFRGSTVKPKGILGIHVIIANY